MAVTRDTPAVTRSQAMKQTILTSSPDGSVIIESGTSSGTPIVEKKHPSTPGRAVRVSRCTGKKTLFPTNSTPSSSESNAVSSKSVVETIISELLDKIDYSIDRNPVQSAETSSPPQERDLEDMLRDALEPSPSPSEMDSETTPDEPSMLKWYKERCVQLQRDLIESEVKFTKVRDHAASLETMVNILNEDINVKVKEIKRIQGELDKSRLEYSKAVGIHKHFKPSAEKTHPQPPNQDNLPKGTTGGKKSNPKTSLEATLESIQKELAANKAQMIDIMSHVTSSNSRESEFETVTSRRVRKQQRHGATPPPPSYSDVTAGRIPKPEILSFGSSQARGTKNALHNHGVRALEYNFPGANLQRLKAEIIPILERNPQIKTVILNTGGIDCSYEGVPLQAIKERYDELCDIIKIQQGWECEVIFSAVPQRRNTSTETRHKIAGLNLMNKYHADPDKHVHFVDAAPKVASYFYDNVHLNHHGLDFWARKMSSALSNFHSAASTSRA